MVNPGNDGIAQHGAPTVKADAKNRAWRTFLPQFVIDVLLAVALVIQDWAGNDGADWKLLALTVAKTVLTTIATFVLRFAVPPAS